jgi:hypothetical protein
MFKKALVAATALAGLMLFAVPQAEAHGHGHGHGSHWKFAYYGGGCAYISRPVTIRVWSDYKHRFVYKTVYQDFPLCY